VIREMGEYHTPVLLKETIEHLNIKKGGKHIDATLGGGRHAEAILQAGGDVLGIDHDPEALEYSRKRLTSACPLGAFRWILAKGNFSHLTEIAKKADFEKVDGILFDLGVSSHQLETSDRGFSFNTDALLDMRMDPELKVTAADLINGLNEGELNELFTKLGEEHRSRAISDAICRARRIAPIKTCNQLAEIVTESVVPRDRFGRIPACYRLAAKQLAGRHPATKVFQALRICVNDELNNLKEVLPQTKELLKTGGRLVIVSFHSLEDGIVKRFFHDKKLEGSFKVLNEKPITPTKIEVDKNPRARSAKLRAGEKLETGRQKTEDRGQRTETIC